MTTAIASVHRQFTIDESKAINSVTIPGDSNDVFVTYQSNPDKVYNFIATDNYIQFLSDLLTNDEMLKDVSMGKTITDARRTEELKSVW